MIVDCADARSPEVCFDHWRFRVIAPDGLDETERPERIRRLFATWYQARAAERLRAGVERWGTWVVEVPYAYSHNKSSRQWSASPNA